MSTPYDAIVKKYQGASAQAPAETPTTTPEVKPFKVAVKTPAGLDEKNPYTSVVTGYLQKQKQARFDKSNADAEASIENSLHPDILTSIKETVTGIPGAVKDLGKTVVNKPLESAQSLLLGLMDVGPAVVNTIGGVLNAGMNLGTNKPIPIEYLPMPSEMFNDYVGRTDENLKAISEGSKQFGSFELGSGAAKVAGVPKLLQAPVGNVVGGQIIADPNTSLQDRANQAKFDAAFGVAQSALGMASKTFGRRVPVETPKVEVKAPTETPKISATETSAPKVGEQIGGRKIPKMTPVEPPISNVKFMPKANLGVDKTGEKVLATTEYSTKDGRAIVYYDRALDSNPTLRQTVIDHEIGHVLDKRVNSGRNISAALKNPQANEATMRNVLGPFARQTGQTIEDAGNKLAADIEKLSKSHGSTPGEKFANAYARYRQDPVAAAKEAPTFDSFMKHTPIEKEAAVTRRFTTEKQITARKAAKEQVQVARETKLTPKAKAAAEPKPVRTPGLSGKEARIELKTQRVARAQYPKLRERYIKENAVVKNGKVESVSLNTDDWRKYFPEYRGTNSKSVHEAASYLNKRLFSEMLKEQKGKGNNTIAIYAGGGGSGKGTAVKAFFDGEKYPIRLDQASDNVTKLSDKIKEAQKNGYKVENVFVDRNPTDAYMHGVVKRAVGLRGRGEVARTVDVETAVKANIEARKVALKMLEDHPETKTYVIDNNGEVGTARLITDREQALAYLRKQVYNEEEIKKTIYEKLNQLQRQKEIPEDLARGFIGERAKVDRRPQLRRTESTGSEKANVESKGNSVGTGSEKGTRKIGPPNYNANQKAGTGRIASTGLRTNRGVNTKSFNASKIDAPDDVVQLFEKMGAENKNFASQRLSKGNEDIKDLARLTGLSEDELLASKPGSIANSETVTAARKLVLDKANNLMNTLKGIDVSNASPKELQQIRDEFVKLVAMQKTVAGFRTEASNVFRSLGIELAPGENATLSELAGLLKEAGVASEGDAALFSQKVAKQMTLSKLGRVGEGALSTWYSAILSGPKTTARNLLSTGSNILTELAARASNPKQWHELQPALTGLIRGLKMGLGEAREVLSGAHDTGKFMETGRSYARPEIFTGKYATYGTIVESVGRFLNAQDKLLSAGAREMERASLKAKGLPVSQAVEEAITKMYAERTVYHGRPTGGVIGAARDAAQALRKRVPAAKLIVPFVDTVANVMDRQFDYIPITAALRLRGSVITEQATRIMKEYGLREADRPFIEQRLHDQQVGRLALGTLVSTGAVLLAAEGRVSGNGPTNASEKTQLQRTGWRPNSIKIGDVWVPYTYLGPLSGILSMAGNINDKVKYDNAPDKDITSLIGNGLVGWTQTQLNQSFLSGVADLFDVATGGTTPKAYLDKFLTGLVPIPAAYSQTKDMILRQQYQTNGIVDALRVKLGLTAGLQPRLDQFGEPMRADLIFGISPSLENATKVDRYLIANDLFVSIPSKSIEYTIPGKHKEKRKLTPEEYTEYVQESGQKIYHELERRLGEFETMDADRQKKAVQDLVDKIRTQVRGKVMRENAKEV